MRRRSPTLRLLATFPHNLLPILYRSVDTPFGGALLRPLQATVCSPLAPQLGVAVARRLLELGASTAITWLDTGGVHTPLSKALLLRNWRLAELLCGHGAGEPGCREGVGHHPAGSAADLAVRLTLVTLNRPRHPAQLHTAQTPPSRCC